MSALVDDDVLTTFVAYGESPEDVARELRQRGADADRIALHAGADVAPETWSDIVRVLRS
jgi:hypothetical protein